MRLVALLTAILIAGCGDDSESIDAPKPDAPIDAPEPIDAAASSDAGAFICMNDGGSPDAGTPYCGVPTESIMRLCVLLASCNVGLGDVRDCTVMMMQEMEGTHNGNFPHLEYSMLLGCASAASCAEFLDCSTLHHSIPYCTAHPGGSCDGDISVQCPYPGDPNVTGAANYVVDCGAIGLRCATDGGNVGCYDGTSCAYPSAICASCSLPLMCDGAVSTQSPQFMGRFACPPGTVCKTWLDTSNKSGPAPNAGCFADGPPCDPSMPSRCEGSTWIGCESFPPSEPSPTPYEKRLDCGCTGRRCYAGGCDQAGTECVTIVTPDHCEGTTLVTCVNGSYVRVDCTSIGKPVCVAANPPYSGCANSLPDGGL
jgi:hypothetical protein